MAQLDDLDSLLPDAPFREVHSRTIEKPIDEVWNAFLSVTGNDIKLLRPLFMLRGLPAVLLRRRAPSPVGNTPVLDLFTDEGFVMLHTDTRPVDGHAIATFGAAGRFWSPAHNGPIEFSSAEQFVAFKAEGNAKTVARFEAWDEGGRTRLETETIVAVTDQASNKKFALYWAIIRGPSGLLRRSWLAAVDRRANR